MGAFGFYEDMYVTLTNSTYPTTRTTNNYGYVTSVTTTTWVSRAIRIPTNTPTGSNLVHVPLDPKEVKRRRLFALTQEAIQEAGEALRATSHDPTGILPQRPRREASKRLHDRPRFRRRICAGSSRYRVMWG